jgi:hypothetical protein
VRDESLETPLNKGLLLKNVRDYGKNVSQSMSNQKGGSCSRSRPQAMQFLVFD